MPRPFIEQLHIRNYGCIGELTLQLTPLHALIGPNDSGKSTVLRAVRTIALPGSTNDGTRDAEGGDLFQFMRANARTGEVVVQVASSNTSYRIDVLRGNEIFEKSWKGPKDPGSTGNTRHPQLGVERSPIIRNDEVLAVALSGAQLLRLDPDALRRPTNLIPEGTPVRLGDARGAGLAGVYDAILNRDMAAFVAINLRVAELFPTVKAISLKNPNTNTKALGIQLTDGRYVSAEFMSEGLLYFLAFAALPYMEPSSILLIEEPENGLHPARIAEVMDVLREVSKSMQVVLATHSPLVINELKGDEVTVLTRSGEQSVKATLLKDTPNFNERSKVYALGELWVSYADGQLEAPLVQGGPRA